MPCPSDIAKLESAGAGKNNMTVIEQAVPPASPYSPSMVRNLLLSVIIGLLLSGAIIYFRETFDNTVREPEDLRRLFGLVPLGVIPRDMAEDIDQELMDRHSFLNEAYATARTNMNFLTAEGAPRSLMLTSTIPNEGKSLSALALAKAFTLVQKKVLLIDGDFRNSTLEEIFDEAPKKGMSGVLSGSTEPREVILRTKYGFDAITSRHPTSQPRGIARI